MATSNQSVDYLSTDKSTLNFVAKTHALSTWSTSISESTPLDTALASFANTALFIAQSGNVGVGTTNPMGELHVTETTGTQASSTIGSIVIGHGNNGGVSSIVFPSASNYGSDYGYIQYSDNDASFFPELTQTTEVGRLIIGVENDDLGTNGDTIALKGKYGIAYDAGTHYFTPSGHVGVGTSKPEAAFWVAPNSAITELPPAAMTDRFTTLSGYGIFDGTYVATQSTATGDATGAYNAFAKNGLTTFSRMQGAYNGGSGTYAGSVTTTLTDGTSVSGEWIQLQLPVPVILTSYSIYGRNGGTNGPYSWQLMQSMDGTNWTRLDSRTTLNTNDADGATVNSMNFVAYPARFLRLVVTQVLANNTSAPLIDEIVFNGYKDNTAYFGGFVGIGTTQPITKLHVVGQTFLAGNVGIGTTNLDNRFRYMLQLSQDSAAKPSTSSWAVTSDARLKENIQVADYNLCYSNVNALDLKYYKWRDDIPIIADIADRHKLGWIAQDVQEIFPKAVRSVSEMYGLTNVLDLNVDQLYASMYGAVKKLIHETEDLENRMSVLESIVP